MGDDARDRVFLRVEADLSTRAQNPEARDRAQASQDSPIRSQVLLFHLGLLDELFWWR